MKTLTLTALLLSATAVLAGPTENITGCATVPVEGANYTVRADVTCALSDDQPDGPNIIKATAARALVELLTPDEEEAE